MKIRKNEYKKITWIILAAVTVSLILTGIIVLNLVREANARIRENWFFEQSVTTGLPVVLEDAYIVSSGGNELTFIHDYHTYVVDGKLEDSYFGVANIVVNGDKISKISVKPDSLKSTLISYTDSNIFLKNHGGMPRKSQIPIYKVMDNQTAQVDWNDLIIGVSNIECVMENGVVSAILMKEETLPQDIRVVIKNDSDIFYPELYVYKQSESVIVDVLATLSTNNITTLDLTDGAGMVICSRSGQALSGAYEGTFRITLTENGMVLVNEVPLETYVKYVIPSEMQKTFGHEALKAQAVCARTYALSQMHNQTYAEYGANLDDSTAFQVYHKHDRSPETDAAVEETKSEIIRCNGELITCYYYSTSPGVTNDMSSWENENPEYIRMQGLGDIKNFDLKNRVDFSNYLTGPLPAYDKISPFYRWTAALDISKPKDSEKGKLEKITVKERNAAGYVTDLELVYEKETISIKNENTIRNILGAYQTEVVLNDGSTRDTMTMVPSACFEITEQKNGKIVLRGGGFGHGIGMSQYGAKAMAEAGFGYRDIIGYYYNNVVVEQM